MLKFSLFGFPIQVQWFFWLTCVMLGGGFYAQTPEDWIGVAIWTAVVFVSVILHELGHAFVGRHFGAQPFIVLHGLGGLAVMPGLQANRWQSILVSLAGPFAGLLFGGILLVLAPFIPTGGAFSKITIDFLVFVNIFWSIFNLLPILPMDGGQVMRSLLGPKRLRVTLFIGAFMAGLLMLLALYLRMWFLAAFLGFMAYSNWKDRPMV